MLAWRRRPRMAAQPYRGAGFVVFRLDKPLQPLDRRIGDLFRRVVDIDDDNARFAIRSLQCRELTFQKTGRHEGAFAAGHALGQQGSASIQKHEG